MNNEHHEKLVKQALQEEAEQHPEPDYDRVWQRIENTIQQVEEREKSLRRKMSRRIAASILVIVAAGSILAYATLRDAPSLPGPLQQMADSFVEEPEEELLTNEVLPAEEPAEEERPVLEADERAGLLSKGEAEQQLSEIDERYPGDLYYPAALPLENLHEADEERENETWKISLEFRLPDSELRFAQVDPAGSSGEAPPSEGENEALYREIEGVEYRALQQPFDWVEIHWSKDNLEFRLETNLELEQALEMARSVEKWEP